MPKKRTEKAILTDFVSIARDYSVVLRGIDRLEAERDDLLRHMRMLLDERDRL
jgi:hypothetical protein